MMYTFPICLVDGAIKLTPSQKSKLSARFTVVEGFDLDGLYKSQVEGILLHSKVERDFLAQFEQLKWIGVRAHNTSYVDEASKERLCVFGIPSMADSAVAEHTFALILGLTKQLLASHNSVIAGNWQTGLLMNTEIKGKKLGIIGYGKIGKQVAQIGKAFHMDVLTTHSSESQAIATSSIENVLRESDIVTLHLSSKPENVHFMNTTRFSLMKKGAIFINTSRGNMVDQSALISAIKAGSLGGVGLDVFENEPYLGTDFLGVPNVVLTPHVGYVTQETTEKMTDALIEMTFKLFGT